MVFLVSSNFLYCGLGVQGSLGTKIEPYEAPSFLHLSIDPPASGADHRDESFTNHSLQFYFNLLLYFLVSAKISSISIKYMQFQGIFTKKAELTYKSKIQIIF